MRTFIIAEAGVNVNGDLDRALVMADVAKNAGCDAVKFQAFWGFHKFQHLELSRDDFVKIKECCDSFRIEFMATPDTIEAVDFLAELGMRMWKIGSRNATDDSFLRKVAGCARDAFDPEWQCGVILSTGMCDLNEVSASYGILLGNAGVAPIYVLQCVSQYPCLAGEINLQVMRKLGPRFGLSDHTLGIHIPIAAVAMGASVIEKHFTLDKTQDGADHAMSVNPHELAEMVRCIRDVEAAMGDGIKKPTEYELKVRDRLRNYEDCK